MSEHQSIIAALLDIDGTLVDSNDLHARAWVDAFTEAGFAVPFARVRPLLGMGGDKLLPAIDPALSAGRDPGQTIARRRGEIFKAHYLQDVQAFPGAHDLLVRLKESGIMRVVATSAKPDELRPFLQLANIEDLVDECVTSEDVEESKPAPDIVSVALKKAGLAAGQAVMIGDTRFDIEAARSAGVGTIAFRCGGAPESDLTGALSVFDGPPALYTALGTISLSDIVHRGAYWPA